MEKRLLLFVLLFFVVVIGNQLLMAWLYPPVPGKPMAKAPVAGAKGPDANAPAAAGGDVKKPGDAAKDNKPGENKPGEAVKKPDDKKPEDKKPEDPEDKDKKPADLKEPEPKAALEYITLGSLDAAAGTRMLVTITNRGAAVARIELNSARFSDQDDHTGYLGHLAPTDADSGARVQAVGAGTPAAIAGLQVGDVITSLGGHKIVHARDLEPLLATFKPRDKVELEIKRADKPLKLSAVLTRRPLELIRPEFESQPVEMIDSQKHDPLSLLLTLSKIGDQEILTTDDEINGVSMRDVNWEITERAADHVELVRHLPRHELSVVKRYTLAQVPKEGQADPNFKAYHLLLDVEVRREADTPLEVAYRLEGPNGLPTEGWWYMNKISRTWGAAGMRDVAIHFEGHEPELIDCSVIANGKGEPWEAGALGYIGLDAAYFSAILIPQQKPLGAKWHSRIETRLVGKVPAEANRIRLTNVSCRLTSLSTQISRGLPLKHTYMLFAGPKQRSLLAQYGPQDALDEINLSELIYYGWPIWGWFAKPLSHVLHFLSFFGYGLAIVMLTVLVRSCMFPLSRKQALNAQKMQELQPEMKRITEKYKKDLEKRGRAMQELYKKHNYNPMSGCLPMFIQMPIFIGLYRALSIDIELRQTPLISEALGWCTNLAAPDMLWRWDGFAFMPQFLINHLGPYLNVLPLVTVALFLWQQKMFMPPPADETAAMQQKVMQYMMIFMAFMFFKVPSGLCIYFISSSLWGICERKLLPKTIPAKAVPAKA